MPLDGKTGLSRVYFGVPRFLGRVFRATRIPSIVLLIGFIDVPLAISIYLTVYATRYHSTLPLDLFAVGFVQFKIESTPNAANQLPPQLTKLLETMTPEQKETGREEFEAFAVFSLVLAVSFFWWIFALLRFLASLKSP